MTPVLRVRTSLTPMIAVDDGQLKKSDGRSDSVVRTTYDLMQPMVGQEASTF